MNPSVYVETSILSYLTAKPSRDLILAAQQQLTLEWWNIRRGDFRVFISEFVIAECERGDKDAAARRLKEAQALPLLDVSDAVRHLAESFLHASGLPVKAELDTLHISVATVHQLDFLLSWNCTHIANAEIQKALRKIAREQGYDLPTICTPNELIGR